MLDAVLERLFGRKAKGVALVGLFARQALVIARSRGHAEVDVDHVLAGLAPLTDVAPLLAKRGVDAKDVDAILEQLLDERPADLESTKEPPLAPRLKTVLERSVVGDRAVLGPFLDNLVAALPPELSFMRQALAGAAPEIAAFFSAPLSATPDGQLTFEAWEPQIASVVGLMQRRRSPARASLPQTTSHRSRPRSTRCSCGPSDTRRVTESPSPSSMCSRRCTTSLSMRRPSSVSLGDADPSILPSHGTSHARLRPRLRERQARSQ